MAQRLGTVEAEVVPDHSLILVLGSGFDDFGKPDFRQNRICYASPDLLYLVSASNSHHYATVTLEAWDGVPPSTPDDDWERSEEAELPLREGAVYVSAMAERAVSPILDLGPPGLYRVRVEVSGQAALTAAGLPTDPPRLEHFRVRLWPGVLRP